MAFAYVRPSQPQTGSLYPEPQFDRSLHRPAPMQPVIDTLVTMQYSVGPHCEFAAHPPFVASAASGHALRSPIAAH